MSIPEYKRRLVKGRDVITYCGKSLSEDGYFVNKSRLDEIIEGLEEAKRLNSIGKNQSCTDMLGNLQYIIGSKLV